jgi:beta-lactamase regulating signal transducer with metallopeptidase domain/ketosteroid isomerase-like protein
MITDWAALLVEATLKATVGIGIGGLLTLLLSRRSAAERHLVWTTAIVGVLLLPPLAVVAPRWPVAVVDEWPLLTAWSRPEPVPGRVGSTLDPPLRREEALDGPTGETSNGPGSLSAPTEPTTPQRAGERSVAPPVQPSRVRWDLPRLLVVSWSAGALLALAPLALALVRIGRIARRSHPLEGPPWSARTERAAAFHGLGHRRIDVRRAAGPVTPLTWGVLRPAVILPEGCEAWSDAQAYEVLVHEAGHVRRHDCLTQLLASAACVLHWWNPLVWLAARRMLVERERACDDHVLQAGARPSDYAGDLLELARSLGAPWSTSHVTTAMARRSQISGRLLAILDPDRHRGTVQRQVVLASAALAMLVLVPLGGATLVPGAGAGGREATAPTPRPRPAMSIRWPAARPLDLAEAGRELHAREREYAAALERGDLETLAGFYTVDARVAGPSLPLAVGRSSVRSLLQHLVDSGVKRVEFEPAELYPVGELLCTTGTARLVKASGESITATRFMTLWKNEDGTWRIHRDWATH